MPMSASPEWSLRAMSGFSRMSHVSFEAEKYVSLFSPVLRVTASSWPERRSSAQTGSSAPVHRPGAFLPSGHACRHRIRVSLVCGSHAGASDDGATDRPSFFENSNL